MKQKIKLNRRQFLTIVSGCFAGAVFPRSSVKFDSHGIQNKDTPIIKVVGVGGAGGNAIKNMINSGLQGAEFIAVDTDAVALDLSEAPTKIQIGEKLTNGLGSGGHFRIGRKAALENADVLRNALADTQLLFITVGLGGGTGTGAAPVVAEIAKELGVLTVAVVTTPFPFEGKRRDFLADKGIYALQEFLDMLIAIPNAKIGKLDPINLGLIPLLRKSDEIIFHSKPFIFPVTS